MSAVLLQMITYEQVREWFRYKPRTGEFTWAVSRRSRGGLILVGQPVGSLSANRRYLKTTLGGKTYLVHRLIWFYKTGVFPSFDIDHKNGDGLDNRWLNLREAPGSINQENFRKPFSNNKSGLIGAWRSSDGKRWRSVIQVNRKPMFLGYFSTALAAHNAYIKAKRRLHKGCTI